MPVQIPAANAVIPGQKKQRGFRLVTDSTVYASGKHTLQAWNFLTSLTG